MTPPERTQGTGETAAIRCPVDSMEANVDPPDRTPDLYRRLFDRCPHCSGNESNCRGHRKWRL